MADLTVGVTGATGFVGGRLAERLVLDGGDGGGPLAERRPEVVAAVRRYSGSGLARLARLPVRLELADLLQPEALERAFADCDVIVHCAYGTGGPEDHRRRVTVEGTRNVVRAARAAGAERLIHLSTAAVHRADAGETVDEETPFATGGSLYEEMKLEAERVVREAHARHGLPAVVLRPTLIWGPRGRRWTVRIAEQIREGAVVPEDATTSSNLVYVDNVVEAVLRAAERDEAVGESFVLVDARPPSWERVYESYAGLFPDAPPLRRMSVEEIRAERRRRDPGLVRGSLVQPFRVLPEVVRAAVGPQSVRDGLWKIPWLAAPARLLPRGLKARIKGEGADSAGAPAGSDGSARSTAERDGSGGGAPPAEEYGLPAPDLVELCTDDVAYSSGRADRVLGDWRPVGFREGMERTAGWLRYQRIAPGAPREASP